MTGGSRAGSPSAGRTQVRAGGAPGRASARAIDKLNASRQACGMGISKVLFPMSRPARLALAGLLAVGLASGAHPARADDGTACFITSVSGPAEVSARGAGRQQATPGLGLGRNATLRTGPEARVQMACPHGLAVAVGPDSEIVVSGVLDGAARPFGLRLMDGIAGFLFDRDGGDGVQVRTPSAVAAVRSTEWAMRVERGASAVFAREGSVLVAGGTGSVTLRAGDGVDVAADGAVGPVRRWGQPRIDLFDRLLGPGW